MALEANPLAPITSLMEPRIMRSQRGTLTDTQATRLLEQAEKEHLHMENQNTTASQPDQADQAGQPDQAQAATSKEAMKLAHQERMAQLRQQERERQRTEQAQRRAEHAQQRTEQAQRRAEHAQQRTEQAKALVNRGKGTWRAWFQDKEPTDHFEQIRSQIEKFDDEKRHPIESLVIFGLTMLAYLGPTVVALFIGQEIGDAYGGPWHWQDSWSMGTHVVAWVGELAQAMFVVAISTAARRQVSDPEYRGRLIWSIFWFGLFIVASGLAQWFVAKTHIAAMHLDASNHSGQVALGFRVVIPAIFDIGSALYLAIMKVTTMKRYLAEQAQKAEAIEQINKSHLRVEEAQEDARRSKEQHDQYMESLKDSQELVNELQRIMASSVLTKARRALEEDEGEAKGKETTQLVEYVPNGRQEAKDSAASNGRQEARGPFRQDDHRE